MSQYADAVYRPIETLTAREQAALLRVTGEHVAGYRDHCLLALALATGLRESELLALDVGDLRDADGRMRARVKLRVYKRSCRDPRIQVVLLSVGIRRKLARLLALRGAVDSTAPVFVSRRRRRLSARQVRRTFAVWQVRAGFERHLRFHALRHSAISSVYRATRDLRLAQRFARQSSILSTAIYAHPTEEDLVRAVERISP